MKIKTSHISSIFLLITLWGERQVCSMFHLLVCIIWCHSSLTPCFETIILWCFLSAKTLQSIWFGIAKSKSNPSQGKQTNKKPKLAHKKAKQKLQKLEVFNHTSRRSAGWWIPPLLKINFHSDGGWPVCQKLCEHCDIKWSLNWLNIFMSIYH